MYRSIGLILWLPQQYFSSILDPFGSISTNTFPAIGVIALCLGIGLGIRRRASGLFFFLIPLLLSELIVAAAGAHLRIMFSVSPDRLFLGFLVVQALLCAYLIYRSKGARGAATALTLFSLTYALAACVVSWSEMKPGH